MKPASVNANVFFIFATVSALLVAACSKQSIPPPQPQPDYTQNMGGERSWYGSYYQSVTDPQDSSVSHITDFNYSDTTFEVIVLSNNSVKVFNDTFSFERADDLLKVYYFGTAWEYYAKGSGKGVAYFYKADSLVYVDGFISSLQTTIAIRSTHKK